MSDENNLDLETFQVYPDEEPQRKTAEPTDKKGKKGLMGKTMTSSPFTGGKNTSKSKSSNGNNLLDKITPTIASVIGVGIVFVFIAVDLML